MVSGMMNSGGHSSAFRKRLNSYMNDGSENNENSIQTDNTQTNSNSLNQVQANANKVAQGMQNGNAPSIDEMMKNAKKQKKVAKVNSDFKKKMKDMGL